MYVHSAPWRIHEYGSRILYPILSLPEIKPTKHLYEAPLCRKYSAMISILTTSRHERFYHPSHFRDKMINSRNPRQTFRTREDGLCKRTSALRLLEPHHNGHKRAQGQEGREVFQFHLRLMDLFRHSDGVGRLGSGSGDEKLSNTAKTRSARVTSWLPRA